MEWDEPLPEYFRPQLESWISTLAILDQVKVPRCLYPESIVPARRELHVFCDASEKALGNVAYMRTQAINSRGHVGFISSVSLIALRSGSSIPRLVLCAAVEEAAAGSKIITELERKPDIVCMHVDSKVILGYLNNNERRFSKYILRRVDTALYYLPVKYWHYVNTKNNPADFSSRPTKPNDLIVPSWYKGPEMLWGQN